MDHSKSDFTQGSILKKIIIIYDSRFRSAYFTSGLWSG